MSRQRAVFYSRGHRFESLLGYALQAAREFFSVSQDESQATKTLPSAYALMHYVKQMRNSAHTIGAGLQPEYLKERDRLEGVDIT
jgi:hypothetical protein